MKNQSANIINHVIHDPSVLSNSHPNLTAHSTFKDCWYAARHVVSFANSNYESRVQEFIILCILYNMNSWRVWSLIDLCFDLSETWKTHTIHTTRPYNFLTPHRSSQLMTRSRCQLFSHLLPNRWVCCCDDVTNRIMWSTRMMLWHLPWKIYHRQMPAILRGHLLLPALP